jgi:protein-tyrosine-phosphatase
MSKPLIYFLCTGNSCRSQIAEGFYGIGDLMIRQKLWVRKKK